MDVTSLSILEETETLTLMKKVWGYSCKVKQAGEKSEFAVVLHMEGEHEYKGPVDCIDSESKSEMPWAPWPDRNRSAFGIKTSSWSPFYGNIYIYISRGMAKAHVFLPSLT